MASAYTTYNSLSIYVTVCSVSVVESLDWTHQFKINNSQCQGQMARSSVDENNMLQRRRGHMHLYNLRRCALVAWFLFPLHRTWARSRTSSSYCSRGHWRRSAGLNQPAQMRQSGVQSLSCANKNSMADIACLQPCYSTVQLICMQVLTYIVSITHTSKHQCSHKPSL